MADRTRPNRTPGKAVALARGLLVALALAVGCISPSTLPALSISRSLKATAAIQHERPPLSPGGAPVTPLQGVTGVQAISVNRAIPFSAEPIIAASPFHAGWAGAGDRARAVDCLADAIYYEAGSQSVEGRRAVAQVVLNRVRHPAFPKTVCGVVFQGAPNPGCQFTFACDGSMARHPSAAAWVDAKAIAVQALEGYVMRSVGEATHYHADYVTPAWSPQLAKITQVGAHIFYSWRGYWGLPAVYGGRYGGVEPVVDLRIRNPAVQPPAVQVAQAAGPEEPRSPDDVGGRVELGHGWTPSPPSSASGSFDQLLAAQSAKSGA